MCLAKKPRACGLVPKLLMAAIMAVASVSAMSQEVIPDFYKEPGIYPNRSYVNQGFGEFIDPFTGALQLHYVDLHLPGNGGFDLQVLRSYNSASVEPTNPAAHQSLTGVGWNIHFGRVLKNRETSICVNKSVQTVADNPVLELPDGSRQLLAFTGRTSPLMLTTQRWRADCIASGAGGLAVTSPDGTRYDMTQLVNLGGSPSPTYAWFTSRITDRNGNYATIHYAAPASPQISSVVTNDGRSVQFSYADSGMASRRITSISAAGQTYGYNYQSIPYVRDRFHLASVTRPDGLRWQYEYHGNLGSSPGSHILSRLVYPEGAGISYQYGFVYFDTQANPASRSTVVTSKSTSAGSNWSFHYTPGSAGTYDVTTVNTPAGSVIYRHIGPNYTASGTVWMVGLLASKTMGGVQTEAYTWGKQKISSENNFRPGAFVTKVDIGEFNAPVLVQRTIRRDNADYTTSYGGFDAYGNPTSITESGPFGGYRTTSLSYYTDPYKWLIRQVQNESHAGANISRSFDGNGNMTTIVRDGIVTRHTYDGQGNISSTTFPRGLTHYYSAYKRGIAQSQSQPEGISISRVVSDAGNVTAETLGDGSTYTYGYDGLNRITAVRYPSGNGISISYGATTRTVSRGPLTEVTSFNGFGQAIAVNRAGIVRRFSVDALGRRTFESHPGAGIGTAYRYDILDRLTSIRHADGSAQTIGYGAATRTVVDERGQSTTYGYRSYGDPDQSLLMSIATPEPATNLSITRNAKDLPTSITQGGVTRSYGYNSSYQLTSVTHPETGTISMGRDAAGNMTSRSIGGLGTTLYRYDGHNRLQSIAYPGSASGVTHTYDRAHRLLSTATAEATRRFAYDSNGNIIREDLLAGWLNWSARYAYNGNDQLTAITYPRSGSTVYYTLDSLGRPTAIPGYISSATYWPSNQLQRITYGNGTQSEYGQNERLLPSSFSTSRQGRYMHRSVLAYDQAANLTSITDAVDAEYGRSFSYDGVNRLVAMTTPRGRGTISYSGAGNIIRQMLGNERIDYQYDGRNRLSSTAIGPSGGISSHAYDPMGNIVQSGQKTYDYDAVPNLLCADCQGRNPVHYTYDGDQKRTSTTKNGVTIHEFHGVHGNLLAEYSPGRLTEYIYLNGKRIAQKVSAP